MWPLKRRIVKLDYVVLLISHSRIERHSILINRITINNPISISSLAIQNRMLSGNQPITVHKFIIIRSFKMITPWAILYKQIQIKCTAVMILSTSSMVMQTYSRHLSPN